MYKQVNQVSPKRQIFGFIFTIIIGTLLHFTFEWSGKNPVVAAFSAVNESTFEHLKLIAVPMLVFSIIEHFWYGKSIKNFLPVRILSIILGMFTITALFYTYVGIIGNNYMIADISIFVIAAAVSYIFTAKLLGTARLTSPAVNVLCRILTVLLVASIIAFTFYPPRIQLFQDPITQNYGI